MRNLREVFKNNEKKATINIITVFVVGLLLIVSTGIGRKDDKVVETTQVQNNNVTYEQTLENRLEEALKTVNGAGEVKVMVTIESGTEKQYVTDEQKESSYTKESDNEGGERVVQTEKSNSNIVFENNSSKNTPLVSKQKESKIQGVLIVTEGGDNVYITEAFTRVAVSLLGVSADKVTVLKMN